MNRNLLCVIQGHADRWEAICLDLDLVVAGTSFDEVKRSLDKAVVMYVDSAREEEPEVRDRLMARRAPLMVRTKVLLRLFYALLRNPTKGADIGGGFLLPCPA